MKRKPIDGNPSRLGRCQLVAILAKSGETPGVQAKAKDGTPKWTCQILHTPPAEGEFVPKAALEEITISCDKAPNIAPLTEVIFENLISQDWIFAGRSGSSLSASGITPVATKNAPRSEGTAQ